MTGFLAVKESQSFRVESQPEFCPPTPTEPEYSWKGGAM